MATKKKRLEGTRYYLKSKFVDIVLKKHFEQKQDVIADLPLGLGREMLTAAYGHARTARKVTKP